MSFLERIRQLADLRFHGERLDPRSRNPLRAVAGASDLPAAGSGCISPSPRWLARKIASQKGLVVAKHYNAAVSRYLRLTMRHQRPLIDWLLLLVLTGLWGTSFLVIKLAVRDIPPMGSRAVRAVDRCGRVARSLRHGSGHHPVFPSHPDGGAYVPVADQLHDPDGGPDRGRTRPGRNRGRGRPDRDGADPDGPGDQPARKPIGLGPRGFVDADWRDPRSENLL